MRAEAPKIVGSADSRTCTAFGDLIFGRGWLAGCLLPLVQHEIDFRGFESGQFDVETNVDQALKLNR
jgi:hypothetical protein